MAKDISDFMLNGPQDLREGESYFQVTYCDTKSEIPLIETWIYVGKDLLEGDGPRAAKWYFKIRIHISTGATFFSYPKSKNIGFLPRMQG